VLDCTVKSKELNKLKYALIPTYSVLSYALCSSFALKESRRGLFSSVPPCIDVVVDDQRTLVAGVAYLHAIGK